jgi:multiple sugar transport system substrate-binding protein
MYAKAGVLVPLDTLAGFTEFIVERCSPETIEEITSSDGHIYQIPWKINPIMTLYNKRLENEFGLSEIPLTYDAYLKAGETIKKDKDNDGYIDQWIGYTEVKVIWYQRFFNFYPLYLAASDGGSLVKDNKAAFNNEYAIGVFRFLQELYEKEYYSKERLSAGQDRFITEDIFTKWTGPWEIRHVEKFKQREDFDFAYSPMQVPDHHEGPVYTYADPKNIVIFNTCHQPQEAWDFIKTMIDREGDKKFLEMTGQLPNRKNLETDEMFQDYFEQNPKVKTFAKQANYVKGVDNCEIIVEVFDIISQEYEACVIYNKKTPEKAIADAAKAVDNLLLN